MACIKTLTEKIVISAPKSSYRMENLQNGRYQITFDDSCGVSEFWQQQTDAYMVDSSSGNQLALVRVCTLSNRPLFTLLFSHSRDMDIGTSLNCAATFVNENDCDVVTWDFATYGASRGNVSESSLKTDACAVFQFLTDDLHIPVEKIVCLGESLGSFAALSQASQCGPAGVILIGAFESILRKVSGSILQLSALRCFNNRKLIASVNLPTLIIHGRQDKVFGSGHPNALYSASPSEEKRLAFLDGCKHMGCTTHPDFPKHFRRFIEKTLKIQLPQLEPLEDDATNEEEEGIENNDGIEPLPDNATIDEEEEIDENDGSL